jgi:nucleoside-diphosphate-sugar epimerase
MAPEAAERANVVTVEALAPLVSEDTHLVHVSTAYAVGLRGDVESPDIADYRNSYEWSKAHAERLARERFANLTIVRPPLIVGRRADGRAARFAGMYTVLRGITSSMVPVIVGEAGGYFEVIPVDDLAEVIADVVAGPGSGEVLTVAGGTGAPDVETAVGLMTTSLNAWRTERGLDPFDEPKLVSRDSWNRFFLPFARSELTARQLRVIELLANFEPYLALTEPLVPTHPVRDIEPCISTAVSYWAGVESRQASLAPKPWKAAA